MLTHIQDDIEGFDPLMAASSDDVTLKHVFEAASKKKVLNILKSYTGYFDVFSEMTQNGLDALERRLKTEPNCKPKIWVEIDIQNSRIRVVDNGIGMSLSEFKFCLAPDVSFKVQTEGRGHKGVGATFLAYGFSFIKIQTKQAAGSYAAVLRQGRQWAEDASGTVPRPVLERNDFGVPELAGEASGTSVEIIVGQSSGERPRNLGWLGAHNADQWLDILRIKTPVGGVYLHTPKFQPEVHVKVIGADGTATTKVSKLAEYYYPHEMPGLKAASIRDVSNALEKIAGDAQTKFAHLDPQFKRLDCLYEIWDKDDILSEDSVFASAVSDEYRILIERHQVCIYASFLRSAKLWSSFNDEILKIRKGQGVIRGGLQLASDSMVQGDLAVIPLTSAIGYQANSHIVVHFVDGNPDMGRKTFQPELKDLAEDLAVRAVTIMRRYLQHLKPDAGPGIVAPAKELHEWKKRQEQYRDQFPLSFSYLQREVALASMPQQEQDAIALFHELIGIGLLKGLRFFSTTYNDTYDSLFFCDYPDDSFRFDRKKNPLGVSTDYLPKYQSEPKVLEYKYDFDTLVSDFEKEVKYAKHVDLAVCWRAGNAYKKKFYLQSLLIGDEGSTREIFGSTHAVLEDGGGGVRFAVLILEDLLNFVRDPVSEEARQKTLYRE